MTLTIPRHDRISQRVNLTSYLYTSRHHFANSTKPDEYNPANTHWSVHHYGLWHSIWSKLHPNSCWEKSSRLYMYIELKICSSWIVTWFICSVLTLRLWARSFLAPQINNIKNKWIHSFLFKLFSYHFLSNKPIIWHSMLTLIYLPSAYCIMVVSSWITCAAILCHNTITSWWENIGGQKSIFFIMFCPKRYWWTLKGFK